MRHGANAEGPIMAMRFAWSNVGFGGAVFAIGRSGGRQRLLLRNYA